ncbi:hypothetical protein A4A49_29013 [Nicotiana attenuata]|uniref:RNase H type-1 domain-containing protein n=1 Tax=Nicotiana attenuata TaxID=49451 RepID=A0A1J6KF30_NICAT|nr:hypothetical protein A4A49_29013 [Nicotiana attenuata]
MALLLGLQISLSHNFHPLIIETDLQVLLSMIRDDNALYSHLILDCRSLLRQLQHVELRHIYREANSVADSMAKFGMTLALVDGQQSWHPLCFMSPSPFVLSAFNKDCSEAVTARTVPLCTSATLSV